MSDEPALAELRQRAEDARDHPSGCCAVCDKRMSRGGRVTVEASTILDLLAERACLLAIKDAAERIEPYATEWLSQAEFQTQGAGWADDRQVLAAFRAALSALPEDQT